ncbi:hypothetical protein BN946_scf184805.g3 [Trametes cinnabarina]|uniref:Uncharacterized protein n=1 Tax=Pycnoporus cinnabarinus TaxID=5643 RepID=A0A060S975_PYCCI|nr:hypothetical protein BN946_scf184805.g3 [Trametes cinnabarina]
MSSPRLTAPNGVSISSIQFNEAGLSTLRSFLGDGAVYQQFKRRFTSADFAWFASGTSQADLDFPPNSFHRLWAIARETSGSTPDERNRIRTNLRSELKTLLFDVAALLDKVQGGNTLILHTDGTVRPGEPVDLTTVKVDVHILPHVLQERPGVDVVLAQLVQLYVEGIGYPATMRWHQAFRKAGFSVNELPRSLSPVKGSSPRPFMPAAKGNTTHYVCYGREVGEVEDMINAARQATHRDRDHTARDGLEAGGEVPGLGAASTAPDPSTSAPYDTARDPDVLMMKLYSAHQALADKDNKIKLLNKQIKFLMQACGMFANDSSDNEETNRQDDDNDGGRSRGRGRGRALHPRHQASARTPKSSPAGTYHSRPASPTKASPVKHEMVQRGSPSPSITPRPSPSKATRSLITSDSFALSRERTAATSSPFRYGRPESPDRVRSPTITLASARSSSPGLTSITSALSASSISEWSMTTSAAMGPVELPIYPAASESLTGLPEEFSALHRGEYLVGPATARVVNEYGLGHAAHRDLRLISGLTPPHEWAERIRVQWEFDETVIDDLVIALLEDVRSSAHV